MWVTHFDTDKCIVFNYIHSDNQKVQNTLKEYNRLQDKLPPIGKKTVLQVIRKFGERTKWNQDDCMAMVRILFGPQEESKTPPSVINGMDSTKFNILWHTSCHAIMQRAYYGVKSLTLELEKVMSGTQKKNEELMETAKKQEEKLAVLEKEFSELHEKGDKLKLEQVQSSGLFARFQVEKDAVERKYGQ